MQDFIMENIFFVHELETFYLSGLLKLRTL